MEKIKCLTAKVNKERNLTRCVLCENYANNKIIEIIEDNRSTKRTTKELSKGQTLILNQQNKKQKKEY